VRYNLEWDPGKARENLRKHRVSFEHAAELFLDPLAVSALDEDHSEDEERWVTIGSDSRGRVLVLIHTFAEVSPGEAKIRMISARKATKSETRQDEDIER
jgi:uncharacterized DUF497 family protein